MALIELVFRRKQKIHTALSHSCNHTLSVLICSQWTFFFFSNIAEWEKNKKTYDLLQANSDYGRFNCNNMGANSQSWNYRSCWHQTGPLLGFTTLEKCDPIHKSSCFTWNWSLPPPKVSSGKVSRLLLPVDIVAISQAPSPAVRR